MRLLLAFLLVSLAGLAVGLAPAQANPEGDPEPRAADRPVSPPVDRANPAPPPAPRATGGKAGTGAVELRVGYYDNDDSGSEGNPFLDESLTDIEPVVVIEFQATDRLRLTLTGSYDSVSSASIDRLSNYSNQSGASGDNYFSGDLAARYEVSEDVRIGGHFGASVEYDYRSLGFGASVEVDLAEKNATLSLGFNAYLDQIDVIRFNGDESEGGEDRTSLTLNLGYYQILSPTIHLDLGASFTYQTGFLETAYNGVILEDPNTPLSGSEDPDRFLDLTRLPPGVAVVAEDMPDTRIRSAIFGEVRKHFVDSGTALGFRARLYTDTWGIFGVTAEVKLYQWLVKDLLRARVRYRFYAQTAADDYSERFFVPQGQRTTNPFEPNQERTQDSDLSAFSSHTLGLKLVFTPSEHWTFDLGGDYVLRSDGIDQILLSFGARWEF